MAAEVARQPRATTPHDPTGPPSTARRPFTRGASAAVDPAFHRRMALALALPVVVGFGPLYYGRLVGATPPATFSGGPVTPLVHVHGTLFTAWVLLYLVQTTLVARRRVAVHRRLGVAGAVLAAAMVGAGALASLGMAARGVAPPGVDPVAFALVGLTDLLLFATFVVAALRRRGNRAAHARLMLMAYVSILAPAVARLPGVLALGPLAIYGITFLYVVVGAAHDRRTRGRVHRTYWWGGGLLLLSVPLRLALSDTEVWRSVGRALIDLVR